jgi:large subunit ribosomal protein L35
MPKMKTNKTAAKKLRVTASGRVKRGQANKSHNTAKKTAKRKRKLRKIAFVDNTSMRGVQGMLPYMN